MKEKRILLFCFIGVLFLASGYILMINKEMEEDKITICTLKGHVEEFKKYQDKEWIDMGSYRKDIVYKIESESEIERGYQLVFGTSDDFNLLKCEEILNQSCTDVDFVTLTKYVENDEGRYDFMNMKKNEIIDTLESNGYVCEKR